MSTDSLAARLGSFHLAILRCEGHRTEVVGKPGELGWWAVRGRRWEESKFKAKALHTLLCGTSSVFPLLAREGTHVLLHLPGCVLAASISNE